ncbi:MAG: cell division protein FtsZ, partial [Microcella pacifica]
SNLGIFEINDAAKLVQEAVHPEANIIFGAVIDDTLGDEVRVTVIAAGFDGGEPSALTRDRRSSFVAASEGGSLPPAAESGEPALEGRAWADDSELGATAPIGPLESDDDSDLDVPDFLR